ncbi:STAS domain-containing protein [Streptomyces olivochromogenes]|uniref:STAS domain-containing protein n=1 Tax=Streptomyces olivochromogenes TaxID=1963 RepID=UPI001F2C5F21|nr:STAS domain-containing protein [Streptomyces olivochromogenes]MCF3137303.1 STAS domain-containing protein [Streptomyces olivochromogenes]
MTRGDGYGDLPSQPGDGQGSPQAVEYAQDGAWVIAVPGAWDLNSLAPLTATMEKAAAAHALLVVDASAVTFADSSFLNLLLSIHNSGTTTLRLAVPAPQLQRVLQLTGADTVLDIRATVHDATTP